MLVLYFCYINTLNRILFNLNFSMLHYAISEVREPIAHHQELAIGVNLATSYDVIMAKHEVIDSGIFLLHIATDSCKVLKYLGSV